MKDERPIVPPGTRFGEGGRYEIREPIGRGGMAIVYKVADTGLDGHTFAAKILALPEEVNITDGRRRALEKLRSLFLEESRALARVKNDNVVTIITNGVMSDADRTPYMVMEYLTGIDLRVLLKREKSLAISRAADIMQEVSHGVTGCHIAGVIHRDLKPGNIFLNQTLKGESAKVLDFSVAKVPTSPDQTKTDFVVGTVDYMAPEQKKGKPANERSDQYSLGALLHFCLIGEPPVGLTKPREIRPEIPEGLEAVLLRAMNLTPERRFDSVYDFGRALLPYQSPEGRAKWKHYYTTPPIAMRAAFTGPLPTPRSLGIPEPALAPTRIEPYDFKAHERTTHPGGAVPGDSLALPTIVDGPSDIEGPTDDLRPAVKAPPTDVDPPQQHRLPTPALRAVPRPEMRLMDSGIAASSAAAVPPPSGVSAVSTASSSEPSSPDRRRRIAVAIAVAVLGGGAALALGRYLHRADPVPAVAPAWAHSIGDSHAPTDPPPRAQPQLPAPQAHTTTPPPAPPAASPTPTAPPAPVAPERAQAPAAAAEPAPPPTASPARRHHRSQPIQLGTDGVPILH